MNHDSRDRNGPAARRYERDRGDIVGRYLALLEGRNQSRIAGLISETEFSLLSDLADQTLADELGQARIRYFANLVATTS